MQPYRPRRPRASPLWQCLSRHFETFCRVSAIACIVTLGDAADKSLLEKLSASTNRRLRGAVESALKRFGKGE